MIVGHNHPSGNGEHSAADRAITLRLKQALALVEIRLLDHFVIGDGAPVSLAARGWVEADIIVAAAGRTRGIVGAASSTPGVGERGGRATMPDPRNTAAFRPNPQYNPSFAP